MKPSLKIPPRPLAILALIALLVIVLIWQNNRPENSLLLSPGAVTTTPAASGSKTSSKRASTLEADELLTTENARTDVTVSRFPIKEYAYMPQPNGNPAGAPIGNAYIHIPSIGRRISIEPNQIGEFPAIETKLNDTIGIRLTLDAVNPGTPVRIVILDGGTFPATPGTPAQVLPSTTWGGTAFEFTTSANAGAHRILVQAQGHPARILHFNAHDTDNSPAPFTAATH
jgi:hypothetical protein